MKKLKQTFGVLAIGILSFSFTTKNELLNNTSKYSQNLEVPKVVILDIVDNTEPASQTNNIVSQLKLKLETLDKNNVNILLWKDLTKGLKEEQKKSVIDSLKPQLIMTLNFDTSEDNTNKVAFVVSKQNVAFDNTFNAARELAEKMNSNAVKNDGVYKTDSKYVQDNAAPSIFLSLKLKNDAFTNAEIVSKLSNFIETVQINNNFNTNQAKPLSPPVGISKDYPVAPAIQK